MWVNYQAAINVVPLQNNDELMEGLVELIEKINRMEVNKRSFVTIMCNYIKKYF